MTELPSKKIRTFPPTEEGNAFNTALRGLISRIGGGSDEAVWELLDRYSTNILRVVRRHLPPELRTKVDSVDIVQSVWKSMLSKGAAFDHIRSAEDFVGYIAAVARNKVFETHRKFSKNTKRDIRREQPLSCFPTGENADAEEYQMPYADPRFPEPSLIVHARDNWNRAIKTGGAVAERVIQMRLEGMTVAEIADELGQTQYLVRQTMTSILKSLQV
jgi:RNA polymerase sigma factor (sigma-70 family)